MPNHRKEASRRRFGYESLEARNLLAGVTHAVNSGAWHSAATWDNGVPDDQTRAVIDSGVTVDLSGTDHVAQELVVQGNLVAEEGASTKTLTTRWIHVNSGGVFQVGTEADRYDSNDFVITLTGQDPTDTFSVEGVAMPITDNDAFLMAAGGGSLQFFGDDKISFTKLRGTVEAGATEITVEEVIDRNFDGDTSNDGVINWEVGDQIVVASSTQDYSDEEVRTITNIVCLTDGSAVITLDSALANRHYGEIETYSNDTRTWDIDMRAEVALLSRNVKIQGLASQDTDNVFGDRARFDPGTVDGFGAHTMIMPTAGQITVDNVQFDRMGQTARLGRYPIHWHLAGDRSGDVIRNSSITNSNNRGLTIHGTHNVRVEGVVLHDIHGHGFFMEDGVETGNEYIANIAFGIHAVGQSNNDIDLDDPFIVDTHDHVGQNVERFISSVSYWITNPDNTWVGNISAGSEGTGFWFILPEFAIGASADDSQYDGVNANETDLLQFDHNLTHSSHVGLNFDRGKDIEVPVGATLEAKFFGRRYDPPNEPQFNHFTAYKHHVGVYHRGDIANFHENRFADNFTSTFITFTQRVTNTLYVGNSRGNADLTGPRTGHSLYDGSNTLDGNHFGGFAESNAHMFRIHGVGTRHVNHLLSNTSYEDDDSANHVRISTRYGGSTMGNPLEQAAAAVYDVDGTLTGHAGGGAGTTIVAEHPFFFDTDDIKPAGWNARISDDVYSMLRFSPENSEADIRVTTPDGDSAVTQRSGFSTHVKTDDGDYVVDFPEGVQSVSAGMEVTHWGRLGPTGSTVVRFEDLAPVLLPQNVTRVNGLDNLRNATETSFEILDGDVWVKFFSSSTKINFAFEANDAPTAVDDPNVVTDEDVAVTIAVTDNDSDPNNDTLYVSVAAVAVADYVDDFQQPNPASNWQYLWNESSSFGDESGYADLTWAQWRYHPVGTTNFPYLTPNAAHPGDGTSEGNGVERFAIAAFTVPVDGVYSIANSSITPNENTVNGVNVAAHISGQSVVSLGQFDENDTGASFDGELGFANAGDVIYVALGANESKGADGSNWDFSIVRDGTPANGQLTFNADQTVTYTPDPDFHGVDSFGYEISDGRGGTDSALVTVTVNSAPDLSAPVTIGQGTTNSRSMVDSLVVSFDDIVTLQAGAFAVTNTDLNESATVVASVDNSSGSSVVTLTFSGALTEGAGSLVDGHWLLEIDGSKVESSSGATYDGDGDGVGGGIYTFGDDSADNFFRLFGDFTGDKRVNVFDLLRFRQTYLSSIGDDDFNAQADFNGDGTVNIFDLLRFRQNYLKEI